MRFLSSNFMASTVLAVSTMAIFTPPGEANASVRNPGSFFDGEKLNPPASSPYVAPACRNNFARANIFPIIKHLEDARFLAAVRGTGDEEVQKNISFFTSLVRMSMVIFNSQVDNPELCAVVEEMDKDSQRREDPAVIARLAQAILDDVVFKDLFSRFKDDHTKIPDYARTGNIADEDELRGVIKDVFEYKEPAFREILAEVAAQLALGKEKESYLSSLKFHEAFEKFTKLMRMRVEIYQQAKGLRDQKLEPLR